MEALAIIVQVGNNKDLIKAMVVGMKNGRIPNISVVESIELMTNWQRSMTEILPKFLIMSNRVNSEAVTSLTIW